MPAAKPDMPVSVGLHNFRIKAGQSIKVDKKGDIFIVGSRGKETDTHKNVYTKPVTFRGSPLAGDVQNVKDVYKLYLDGRKENHPVFRVWRGIVNMAGLSFQPYTDERGQDLFSVKLSGYTLVALTENPDSLLYVKDADGTIHHMLVAGPARDIPDTAAYVKACAAEARRIERDREKAEEAAILHREAMRVQAEEERKNAKRNTRMKPHDPTQVVHISKEQSLRAMGLMPSDETQPPKLSKEEMRKLASSTYLRMKAAKEAG